MAAENRGPELLYVCAVMVGLAFISTVLRVYVRLGIVKAFGIDDWFMVAATLTHIMFATCAIGGIHYGTGQHMADLDPHNALKAMRYWWLCYIAYCLTMIAAKISIGYFLLRLTVHKIHVWIIWTVMSLTVLTGLVFFFVTLFQCNPVSHFWTQTIGAKGTCISVDVIMGLTYLYGSISAICDFTFGILPIFLIWNLNMRTSIKVALVPILSMACIASSAVLVRMAYIKDFKNPDFLYATVDIAIWSDTEQGLAITAGSLATLRPLFRMLTSKLGSYGTGRATPNPSANLTPGGIHKQNKTVWPSDHSRGRSGSRGGPWSLLRTETDGDFELVTKVTKVSGGDSPPPPALGSHGITKGTEVQVVEERMGEQRDLEAAQKEPRRKSWWRVTERERERSRGSEGSGSLKEDNESQRELNAAEYGAGRGAKKDPGNFV